jgi:putative ABC transport system permease protein
MTHVSLISAWSHRRRLASTTFAIVLGIAFLTASLVLRDTVTAGFSTTFTAANSGTDAVVRNADDLGAADEPRAPIDASLQSRIDVLDGVAATAASVSGPAQILGSDGTPIGGNGPPTLGANWITVPALTGYRIANGRAPVGPGEVVIDARSAKTGHLQVGSRTTVLAPTPTAVTVVGIARFGDADSLGGATLVAFTLPEAQRLLLHDPTKVTSILVAADAGTSASGVVQRLDRALPDGTEAITGAALTAEQQDAVQGEFVGFFTTALLAFAVVALLVAAFSIFNTFTVLAAQRSRESALLRAIGASRAQVLGAGLIEALLVAIAGATVGIGAGVLIGLGLRPLLGSEGLGLPLGALIVSVSTVLTALATGTIVTVGAAMVPAVRASRIAPIAALRASEVDGGRPSRWRALAAGVLLVGSAVLVLTATNGEAAMSRAAIGAFGLVIALVLLGPFAAPLAAAALGAPLRRRGVAGDLARRNAGRNPRRTAGTAAALLVGVSVVSLFTVFGSSVKASMDTALRKGFSGDLVIVPRSAGGAGLSPAMTDRLAEVPQVGSVAALSFPRVRLDGAASEVTSTDLGELAEVTSIDVRSGSTRRLGDGDFGASTKRAALRGWRVGDRVTASFADGRSTTLRLAFTYGDRTLLGDVVFPAAVAGQHVAQQTTEVVLVRFAAGADPTSARRAVTAVSGGFGHPRVQNRQQFLDAQGAQVDVLLRVIYALLGVAILIAGMGIANTLSLSIHERTRELGLLRAIGQSRRQLRAMVRWESVIVATFGAVGGVGLGIFLGWGMIRALAASEGFGTFALPVVPLAVIVLLGAGLGVLAAVRPARRAARLDVLAAIATD